MTRDGHVGPKYMEPVVQPSLAVLRPDMMVKRPQPALPLSPRYAGEAIMYATATAPGSWQGPGTVPDYWLQDSPYMAVRDVDLSSVYTTTVQQASPPPMYVHPAHDLLA